MSSLKNKLSKDFLLKDGVSGFFIIVEWILRSKAKK